MTPTPLQLLQAALTRDWLALSASTGMSAPRLTMMALHAIDDPVVIAAHPIECRILRDRRDENRRGRH